MLKHPHLGVSLQSVNAHCLTVLYVSLLDLSQLRLIFLHLIHPFGDSMKNSYLGMVNCPLLFKRNHSFSHLLVYSDYLFRSESALYKEEGKVPSVVE